MKAFSIEYMLLILMSVGLIHSCTQRAQMAESPVPAMEISTISDTIDIVLDPGKNEYKIIPLETHPAALSVDHKL